MNNIKIKLGFSLFALLFGLVPHLVSAQVNPNATIEDVVRFYFADIPVMIDIAKCETGFRQYNPDGSALHDASGTYVGVFQIAESIHTPRATSMGFDIRTIDGNLQYARYLYTASGTNPWKGCVPKQTTPVVDPTLTPAPVTPTPVVVATGNFTANLRMGMTNAQVKSLQMILNQNGFPIATTGIGSAGNETNYFGSLTREAVKLFQCAKQIACDGNEATTGFGRIGPMTRAALNTLISH